MIKCCFEVAFELRFEDRLWEEIFAGISDEDKRLSVTKSL